MKIKELFIENFGGLSNKRIKFGNGINLIIGNNESGKSTTAAFIFYMFYGFPDRVTKKQLTDIKTGISSGSVLFELDDGRMFRINRKDTPESKSATVEVRTASGELYEDWKETNTPGEFFMGIPSNLFIRSVFVSQKHGTEHTGDSLEAIRNLLISGSEALDLKRALKKLEDMRVELLHKNMKGGKIYDIENLLVETESDINAARLKISRERDASENLKNTEEELSSLDGQISDIQRKISELRAFHIRGLLANKRRTERDIEEKRTERSYWDESNSEKGYLPDREYVKELKDSVNTAAIKESEYESCVSKAVSLGAEKLDYVRQNNGFTETEKKLTSYFKKDKLLFTVVSVFFVFAIIAVAVGAAIIALQPSLITVALGFFGAFALFTAIAVLCFVKKRKIKAERLSFASPLSPASSAVTLLELAVILEDLKRNTDEIDMERAAGDRAMAERERALGARDAKLELWGKEDASQAIEQAEAYLEKNAVFEASLSDMDITLNNILTKLSVYPEHEIERADSRPDEPEYVDETEEALNVKLDSLKNARIPVLESINTQKVNYAAEFSSMPDLPALEAKREQLAAQKENYSKRYHAATLALDTLRESDAELRRTVTPYLSERAGQLFSEMTASKYEGLGIDGEDNGIRLTFRTQGGFVDSEYLSAGSHDLAWLCLRLAMHARISRSENLPLILDECFVCFDDIRLSKIVDKMKKLSKEDSQIFLFSANHREEELLKGSATIFRL